MRVAGFAIERQAALRPSRGVCDSQVSHGGKAEAACGMVRAGMEPCLRQAGPPLPNPFQREILRRRRALLMTDTELKVIAAAASIGVSRMPKYG